MKHRCRILTLLACSFFLFQETNLLSKDYSIYYTQKLKHSNLNDSSNQWKENFISSPNTGFDPQVLWIKVKPDSVFKFLIIENAHLDSVKIFFYHGNHLLKTQLSGDRVPFSQRSVAFHYINFEIPPGTTTIYLRVKTEGSTATPILLINKNWVEYFINQDKVNWTHFGVLIFTFVLNIIFGIYLKEKIYLYYCMYVLGILFFFLIDFGYFFQIFYPDVPALNKFAPCFYSALVLSYVFAEKYLDISKSRLTKIIFRCMYCSYAAVYVLNTFDYAMAIKLITINFMLTPIVIIGTAVFSYYKSRHRPVLIFIIAWSFYLFFLFIYSLASSGYFPYHLGIANFLLFGSVLEVVILQFAVLYKINELREDNLLNKMKVVSLLEEQHEELEIQKQIIENVNNQLIQKHTELEEQVFKRTKELWITNKDLQEKNQRLEQFSYVAAHNLRGPVATLLGITQLARIQRNQNVKMMDEGRYFESVEKTANKLDTVISGLSVILDIEKNNDHLVSEISLFQILSDVKILLELEIENSGCKITAHFEAPVISGIPVYLNNIFYNLISNTIKYKQENIIPEASIRSYAKADCVVLEYTDNSIGMNLNLIGEKLFKPFKRFNDTRQGLGLGLYMIKVQVDAMNGRIALESAPGKGVKYNLEFKSISV